MSEVEVDPTPSRLQEAWASTGSSGFFQDPSYGELYRATTRHRPVRLSLPDGEGRPPSARDLEAILMSERRRALEAREAGRCRPS